MTNDYIQCIDTSYIEGTWLYFYVHKVYTHVYIDVDMYIRHSHSYYYF